MRPPLEPARLEDWDRAVALAAPLRGLTFEALRRSTPLGFDGESLWAACPEAALICEPSREGASKVCARAFGRPRLRIQWTEPQPDDPQGLAWDLREKRRLDGERAASHQAFLSEPLMRAFAQSHGARAPIEGFEPGD